MGRELGVVAGMVPGEKVEYPKYDVSYDAAEKPKVGVCPIVHSFCSAVCFQFHRDLSTADNVSLSTAAKQKLIICPTVRWQMISATASRRNLAFE